MSLFIKGNERAHCTSVSNPAMLGGMSLISSMINDQNIAKLIQFDRQESEYVEPGLLPMFRLFVAIQLFLLILVLISTYLAPVDLGLRTFIVWSMMWLIVLLGYLVWPDLPRRLGQSYLPIALIAASLLPILNQTLGLYFFLDLNESPVAPAVLSESSWRVLVILLVCLVFTAWQYNLRQVVRFGIGIPLLNLALTLWLVRGSGIPMGSFIVLNLNGALTFLLVGYIIYKLRRAQRDKQAALVEANAKLIDYASTIEQLTVSRERNRLARDMHDTLAHTLSAVSVQLEAADSVWESTPEQAHSLLQKSLANAREGLGETRRALRALRASPLEDLGLGLALRDLAESTAARAGWELEVDVANELNLPSDLEQNIYRIAQEALTNAAQHANARHVRLSLTREHETIQMTISDDGIGFAQNEVIPEGHYGLQGMVERAAHMGATLAVTSRPGSGTTVQLTLKRATGGQS